MLSPDLGLMKSVRNGDSDLRDKEEIGNGVPTSSPLSIIHDRVFLLFSARTVGASPTTFQGSGGIGRRNEVVEVANETMDKGAGSSPASLRTLGPYG